jgi:GNAT superfamily N-acetyltransferase
VRAADEEVGALVIGPGRVEQRAATFLAVAVAPERRGRAFGARTLLAAERRLRREGVRTFYSRVPRTNGRGLYFMLRCGYAPLLRASAEDAGTWFRRFEAGDVLEPGR